jgi:hypothetical protein
MLKDTTQAQKSKPPSDPSIPLCEVLEQEYLEITGRHPRGCPTGLSRQSRSSSLG